jgi:hypothetical protein
MITDPDPGGELITDPLGLIRVYTVPWKKDIRNSAKKVKKMKNN